MELIYSVHLDYNMINVHDLKYDTDLSDEKIENAILNITFTEKYHINKDNLKSKLNISQNTLASGDKVFFTPGVTIPRFKVRELGKEVGFDIVRSSEKANKIVISTGNLFKEITKHYSSQYWKAEDFIKFYEEVDIYIKPENKDRYNFVLNELKSKPFTAVCASWDLQYAIANISKQTSSFDMDSKRAYGYFNILKQESQKDLLEYLYNTTTTLIDDSSVVRQCSGDKTINKETFQRLNQMMKTADNRDVALELMCNYDFEESMFYILLLASKNDFNSFNAKNHVSYKNFRKYATNNWNIDPSYYWGRSIMDILNICFEHNKVSKEILSEHKQDILDYVKQKGETKLFTITGIALAEEYKQKLI